MLRIRPRFTSCPDVGFQTKFDINELWAQEREHTRKNPTCLRSVLGRSKAHCFMSITIRGEFTAGSPNPTAFRGLLAHVLVGAEA